MTATPTGFDDAQAKSLTTFEHVGIKKVPTGIPGLDHITQGGIPENRSTLVTGTSGSAKTVLAVQFLVSGIEQFNENAVFITFEESPADIRRNVANFGWDIAMLEATNRFRFVDCSPDPYDEVIIEAGSYDFSALLARISYAVEFIDASRVAVDSINTLFMQYQAPGIVRREMFRLSAGLRQQGLTVLMTAERTDDYGKVSRFAVEEFVSDNVVVLRNVLEEEKRRRTIEILKYRGTNHYKGEYPFTISGKGIEVLPLSAMELTQESSNERISTGVTELDEMTGGGYYCNSVILASGATGTGKTLLVTTFIDDGSRRGEKTLVFAFEEARAQLLRNAQGWGKDFQKWEDEGLLKIVAAYPESLGLEDHLLNMQREIDIFKPTRIAVDSLSAMERVSTLKSFREFVIGLTSFVKERACTGLFTATTASLMGGTSITETHISTITDSIILLRYVELMGEMRRGITVLKMRGSQHDKLIREYCIDGEGMRIGEGFQNVAGILSGAPQQLSKDEIRQLNGMFDE